MKINKLKAGEYIAYLNLHRLITDKERDELIKRLGSEK